jgi:exonuclease III
MFSRQSYVTKYLKVAHWNCFTIKNKKTQLKNCLFENVIDMMSLNETKLSQEIPLVIAGYEIVRKDRNKKGGGVAILVKIGLKYSQISLNLFENEENIGLEVIIFNSKVNFFSIYVPPNKKLNENHIQNLSSFH